MSSGRSVLLVVPPVADCTMPMLGPYVLAGQLRKFGVQCRVWDASIELLRLVTAPDTLKQMAASARLCPGDPRKRLASVGIAAIKACDDAMDAMLAGLKLFRLLGGPPWLRVDDLALPCDMRSRSGLLTAIDLVTPLAQALMDTQTFAELTSSPSGVIGLSISFPSQLVFGLALAREIKRTFATAYLVLGGAYFQSWGQGPERILDIVREIDVIVCGCGEKVLLCLAQGTHPCQLPGTVQNHAGRLVVHSLRNNSTARVPDFSDVDWDAYVTGTRVAPFSFGSRCYYGRCRFCTGDRDSPVSALFPRTAGFIETVSRYQLRAVYIVDPALPPSILCALSAAANKSIKWAGNVRPDPALTDRDLLLKLGRGGCFMLRYGFESGSQRVLDAMRKGTRLETVSEILRSAAAVGIRNHVYIMLGYPGERPADRDATLAFLEQHVDYIYSYSISIFQVLPGTPVYAELCDLLSLDPRNEHEAVPTIHRHLYPNEETWQELVRAMRQISALLTGKCRSNKRCYSGRVFTDAFACARRRLEGSPVVVPSSDIAWESWREMFSSLLLVRRRTVGAGCRAAILVDLVSDRAICIEGAENETELRRVVALAARFAKDNDIRRFAQALPEEYVVGWVTEPPISAGVVQHTPNCGEVTDACLHRALRLSRGKS